LGLNRILESLNRLEYLTDLKLPPDAAGDGSQCKFNPGCWPSQLAHLQLSLKMCKHTGWWDELFESFPTTLETLIIPNCYSYDPFWNFRDLREFATSIKRLEIGTPLVDLELLPLHQVISRFPSLTMLTLPVTISWREEGDIGGLSGSPSLDDIAKGSLLEVLTFSRPLLPLGFGFGDAHTMDIELLRAVVTRFPLLQRVNVPNEAVDLADEAEMTKLSEVLEERAPSDKIHSAGIFTYSEGLSR